MADYTGDPRVLDLAAEVTEASDKQVPGLLVRLEDILSGVRGEELRQIKSDIWSYDLLQILVVALAQDYNKIKGGWSISAKLVSVFSKCCMGLDPEESHNFFGILLPDSMEKILHLARRIQQKYSKTSSILADTKSELMGYFRSVLDSLALLFGSHNFLTANVLKSSWLQQMLMSENPDTIVHVYGTIQSVCRMKQGVMATVDRKVVEGLLDELIYQLSASSDVNIASGATRTILCICDNNPPIVEVICLRYSLDGEEIEEEVKEKGKTKRQDKDGPDDLIRKRGLRPLLNKWQGKGFGRDLRKLILLLESGSAQRAEVEKLNRAAAQIQATWKSYYTRKKLKKADKAFAKFQRSFRTKQKDKDKQREEEKQEAELRHILVMRRRAAMRQLHTKRYQALDILPPDQIEKHLQEERNTSAVKIQAVYRGYLVRRDIAAKKNLVSRTRAAVRIQRCVRQWLEKTKARKKEPPGWQRPPGLTDQRRVEIQEMIMERRENHETVAKTDDERQTLHEKVQSLLKQHAIMSRQTRKREQQREALLVRLQMDASLLMDMPKLPELTGKEAEAYVCHSVPIATKARYNHNQEVRLLQQPWWRKLGDEYQDKKLNEEIDWKVL